MAMGYEKAGGSALLPRAFQPAMALTWVWERHAILACLISMIGSA